MSKDADAMVRGICDAAIMVENVTVGAIREEFLSRIAVVIMRSWYRRVRRRRTHVFVNLLSLSCNDCGSNALFRLMEYMIRWLSTVEICASACQLIILIYA